MCMTYFMNGPKCSAFRQIMTGGIRTCNRATHAGDHLQRRVLRGLRHPSLPPGEDLGPRTRVPQELLQVHGMQRGAPVSFPRESRVSPLERVLPQDGLVLVQSGPPVLPAALQAAVHSEGELRHGLRLRTAQGEVEPHPRLRAPPYLIAFIRFYQYCDVFLYFEMNE